MKILVPLVILLLTVSPFEVSTAGHSALTPTTGLNCPEFKEYKPRNGPLSRLNCDMHSIYETRVKALVRTFGSPEGRPVILNLGGTLRLKYHGKTEVVDITPSQYQDLKAFCHHALSVSLVLSQQKPGTLHKNTRQALQVLLTHLHAAMVIIPRLKLSPKEKISLNRLTSMTERYLQRTLKDKTWTAQGLMSYYEDLKKPLQALLQGAVLVEINTMDEAINHWLLQLSPTEKKQIGIVIATAHQARASEVSVQYFSKKFEKQVGVGAIHEKGLVVLEGRFDEKSALELLARHYLDIEIGQIVFKNPEIMQRDLLANSARKILKAM